MRITHTIVFACAVALGFGCNDSSGPAPDQALPDGGGDGTLIDAKVDAKVDVTHVDATPSACGNGVKEPGEACDDKGLSATCDPDCSKAECGDGTLNTRAGEQCDDGDKTDGDGCSASCAVEIPSGCGNNLLQTGEVCDDGGESATCNVDCTKAACGDGKLNKTALEECEDGNTKDGDGCSSTCTIEKPTLCGNGTCEASESCAAAGCPADCGACKPGSPCVQNADCESGSSCLVDATIPSGFSCGKPGLGPQAFLPLSGFSCAVALGSTGKERWQDDGKGGHTLKGPVVIRTPTGDIPLTDKDITLTKNGPAIAATFTTDTLPFGIAGINLGLGVSTTMQLAIISGKSAITALGGDKLVPDNASYFEYTFGASLDNIIFSAPATSSQSGKTTFESGKIKDVTLLRFLFNPCDPLAFLQVPSLMSDKASQSFASVGGSAHGGLMLETPLPLWDGKTTKVRTLTGHVYTQGSFSVPKIPLGRADVARLINYDPRNDGLAHPFVIGSAFAGLLGPLGVPANQSDRAELWTGTLRLALPNPKAMADAVGLALPLELGPAGPLGNAALYLYSDEKSAEILFRGRSEKTLFPGTFLEQWSKLPTLDLQGYFRSGTDWGLRYSTRLSFFLGTTTTTTDVELVIGGANVAELTATGTFDISVKIGALIDLNLVQTRLTLHYDWKSKELCGETTAVIQQAPCTVRLCAGAAGWTATASCKASCGDGLCNGVESCYAAAPGCQKDCGACPGATPCTLDSDCKSGKCPTGLCVECTKNEHCSGDDWCALVTGTCEAPKPLASPCTPTKDYECQSGNCPAGACVGCTVAKQNCSSSRFCSALGICEPKKSTGVVCVNGFECKNGKCVLGFCASCNQQSDCGGGEFCAADGKCYSKKKYGLPCVNGFECKSDKCPVGMCVDCAQQSDCQGAWCAVDGKCYGKKSYGAVCVNGFECASNKCIAGLCVDCTQQSHCGGATFCGALGKCQGKKSYGEVCVNGFECGSGRCPTGLCVDCVSQSHCSSGWCAVDGKCHAAKNNGDVCVNGFECGSGVCTGICVECVLHSHCNTATEWCGVDTKCHPKADDGLTSPCLGSVECKNKCCLFFCGSWC